MNSKFYFIYQRKSIYELANRAKYKANKKTLNFSNL